MEVFYIDVFFLINFTVDILALYTALGVVHIHTGMSRLVLCSVLGAISAIIDVFISEYWVLRAINCVVSLLFLTIFIVKVASVIRRAKLLAVFLAVQMLLFSLVHICFSVLDNALSGLNIEITGVENRRALIFSILTLISIGVIKLIIMLFSDSLSEKSVRVTITIEDVSVEADALVDSGNLVRDPMNMNPVLFIKPSLAKRLVPECITDLTDIDLLDDDYRKRIRLIPVTRLGSTHIVTGVRADSVTVSNGKRQEEVSFTVGIDNEEGTYGGYEVLAPYAAMKNVF